MARSDEGEGSDFDTGFYGDAFAQFEKMGETTVRDQLRSSDMPSQQRPFAIEWLRRREAHARWRTEWRANVALGVSIGSLMVGIAGLVIAVLAFVARSH